MQTLIRCHILWHLIWVYTVSSDLSVQILTVNIALLVNYWKCILLLLVDEKTAEEGEDNQDDDKGEGKEEDGESHDKKDKRKRKRDRHRDQSSKRRRSKEDNKDKVKKTIILWSR